MNDTDTILAAIPSSEPISFNEFCSALGADCPEKGDTPAWRELFGLLEKAGRDGDVEISRLDRRIDSLILTGQGAAKMRAKLDSGRGLLNL